MYRFDVEQATEACIAWIQKFFEENGADAAAVVGISGGKDSSVVAALCVRALGRERVLGVLMPKGVQADIGYARELVEVLGIRSLIVNIQSAVESLTGALEENQPLSRQAQVNLPPRIRMATLYAVAQCNNGRVANTCNLSEDWVGYSTRYGDAAGDFSPMSNFTVQEVKAIGRYLGLPEKFVEKPPIDGLCGKTDEDNLGFTYAELDHYIREGVEPPLEKKEKIDRMHRQNLFKLAFMPIFHFDPNQN